MPDVLIVFPKPLQGEDYHPQPFRAVTVIALHGPTETGWQADRTALVVDQHGNHEWIGTDGLLITEWTLDTKEADRAR